MDLSAEIRNLTEPKLAPGQYIVDIVASGRPGQRKIAVIVDADQGMSIDDCAEISRQLSKALDESLPTEENYVLEVTTPGVDQPLRLKRQYNKNIGRRLKVKLQETTLEGKLSEVRENEIKIIEETGSGKKKETQEHVIPFSAIEKAFVLISFK